MKATIQVMWLLTAFCIVVGFIYGFVTDFHELAGFPALLAVGVMSAFLAVYFQLTLRSAKAMLLRMTSRRSRTAPATTGTSPRGPGRRCCSAPVP